MRSTVVLISAVLVGCGSDEGGGQGTPDGVADGTSDGTPVGACGAIPIEGRCNGNVVEFCATATGSADTRVASYPCRADERCRDDGGAARCELAGQCGTGTSECRGESLATCVGGAWQVGACANGCVGSELGSACRPSASVSPYQGRLTYELKAPTAALDGWNDTPVQVPAAGFLVLSFADGVLIDSALTGTEGDAAGTFEVDAVPAERVDGDDYLAAVAARGGANGQTVYLVAKSGFAAGKQDVTNLPPAPEIWLWTWTTAQIASPASVNVPLDAGSGAAFVFDYLRFIYDFAVGFYGERANSPLVVWLDYGVEWSCGACMGPWRYSDPGGANYERQVWLSAGSDEGFWSGPVVAHELGHYVMATYGTWPGEGGQHIIGIASHPGLAWSEGFATWFSAVVRGNSVYYDKQRGAFFWFDIGERRYSQATWQRPDANAGLEQLIDENEIAAMLFGLTNDQSLPGLLAAVASPRMTQAPFLRGYARRAWNGLNGDGLPLPFQSLNESAPHFADYLDAIACGGVTSGQAIDAVTEPFTHYPFPSAAPLCRSGEAPIAAAWVTGGLEVNWHWPLAGALTVTIDGRQVLVVPAGTQAGSRRIDTTGSEAEVRTGVNGDAWGAFVKVSRELTAAKTIEADGPIVRIGARVLGRSVALRPMAVPVVPGTGDVLK